MQATSSHSRAHSIPFVSEKTARRSMAYRLYRRRLHLQHWSCNLSRKAAAQQQDGATVSPTADWHVAVGHGQSPSGCGFGTRSPSSLKLPGRPGFCGRSGASQGLPTVDSQLIVGLWRLTSRSNSPKYHPDLSMGVVQLLLGNQTVQKHGVYLAGTHLKSEEKYLEQGDGLSLHGLHAYSPPQSPIALLFKFPVAGVKGE